MFYEWSGRNLPQTFDRTAAVFADNEALVAGERRLSYRELQSHVFQFAKGLQECGIGAGSTVAAILDNSYEFAVAVLALHRLGAVMVPLNLTWTAREFLQSFALTDPDALITLEEFRGKYILVTEGGTPMAEGGIYCKVGGRTQVDLVREAAEGAAAVIAIGSCASWGGVQSAYPNPTGAVGTQEVIPGKTVINVPGCPPNPYNFLSIVLHILTFGEPPALDEHNRPKFAYGRLIHENCERRPHFDAGRFALEFGDAGHRQGFCLYKIGCKGPETHANCPSIGFGDVGEGNWPVGIGAPCFGCTEKGVGFTKPIHALADLVSQTPPSVYPAVDGARGQGASPGATALVGGVVGVALGAGAMFVKQMADERDQIEKKSGREV